MSVNRISIQHSIIILLCIASLFSCVSPKKGIFFNDLLPSKGLIDSTSLEEARKVQVGDRIIVRIITKEPLDNELLNSGLNSMGNIGGGGSDQTNIGYLVDKHGKIEFPIIGEVSVVGLKSEEIKNIIKLKTSELYKDPVVFCNIMGRVLFLGGGGVTGSLAITNEKLSILDAFALMGIPDPTAKREKVWVIRDKMGEREYGQINLNSKEVFNSPYFYLHNNDLIYVEPGKINSFLNVNAPIRNVVSVAMGSLALLLSFIALTK
jgi:polysaccharide export outer membrane protein